MKTLVIISALAIALFSGCAGTMGSDNTLGLAMQPQYLSGSTLWLPRQ